MSGTADYLDIEFGPLRNHVANAELLDKAGELIISFLRAQGLVATPRILDREESYSHPLLLIVTPRDRAADAIAVLEKSNASHPHYPFMDFRSVAVPVRDEAAEEEGVLFNAGQPVVHTIASALEHRPA